MENGEALALAGGRLACLRVRLIVDGAAIGTCAPAALPAEWSGLIAPLAQPTAPFAGLPADRPLVIGIVNVTPDSFSGDGVAADAAIAQARAMVAAGADLLDIGGESTRPGAAPVAPTEEQRRILPVIRSLAGLVPISVDTRNAATMAAAIAAGAAIVNDVTALRHDPDAAAVVARSGASVVLMHMRGLDPRTMQDGLVEGDITLEVAAFLRDRIAAAEAAGIPRARIAIDPGIGFGKTLAQNLALLDRLPLLLGLGCPVLVGASRKGFIGRLADVTAPQDRLPGSLAAGLAAVAGGASILRVHDVAATVQALRVWNAIALPAAAVG